MKRRELSLEHLSRIELLSPVEGAEDGLGLRAYLDQQGPGLFGLALATSGIDDSIAQLKEKGWGSEEVVSVLAQDGPSGAYRRLSESALDRIGTRGALRSEPFWWNRSKVEAGTAFPRGASCPASASSVINAAGF